MADQLNAINAWLIPVSVVLGIAAITLTLMRIASMVEQIRDDIRKGR